MPGTTEVPSITVLAFSEIARSIEARTPTLTVDAWTRKASITGSSPSASAGKPVCAS